MNLGFKKVLGEVLVVIAYTLLFFLFRPGAFVHFTEWYFAGVGGDPGLYLWLLKHNIRDVLTVPSAGFDAGLFYPFGNTLAYTDTFILPALIAKFALALGATEPAAVNSTILLANILNGYCGYRLCLYFTNNRLASFFGGFVLMSSPYIASQLGHAHLQPVFFLPLLFLMCLKFIETRSKWSAFLIGVTLVICYYWSIIYVLFGLLLCTLTLLLGGLMKFRTIRARDLLVLIGLNIPSVILLYLSTLPFSQVRELFGPRRLIELRPFSGSILSFLASFSDNAIWGWTSKFSNYEGYFFPGVMVYGLMLVAIVELAKGSDGGQFRWRVFVSVVFGWLAIFAIFSFNTLIRPHPAVITVAMWSLIIYCLSWFVYQGFGSERSVITLDQQQRLKLVGFIAIFSVLATYGLVPREGRVEYSVPGVFMVLFNYFPGFNSIRASVRVGILAYIMFTVIAAVGLSSLMQRTPRLFAVTLGLIALVVSGVELRNKNFAVYPAPPVSEIFRDLEKLSGGEAVLGLPFGISNEELVSRQVYFMHGFFGSHRPMLNGYSGIIPNLAQQIGVLTKSFPAKRSLRKLRSVVGLKYIVFVPALLKEFDEELFSKRLVESEDELRVISKTADGSYLLEFNPENRAPVVELFLPPAKMERELSFEICREGGTQREIVVEIRGVPKRTLPAPKTACEPVIVTIPPSLSAVRPQIVKIQTRNSPQTALTKDGIKIQQVTLPPP